MENKEHSLDYLDTSAAVDAAKQACSVDKPNSEMTDDEIAAICRWIGHNSPDTIRVDGEPTMQRMGISAMLFIALSEFPGFYDRHELSQFN